MDTLHHEMYASMSKGKRSLLEMNARMLNYLARSLNGIQTTASRKDLFLWLRDDYTIGSAEALYGPRNPISDSHKFIQAVW